jgi:hypothetical protein
MATAIPFLLPEIAGYAVETSSDLSRLEVRQRLSPPAIEGFLKIVDLWQVRDADARQLLGGLSTGSYHGFKKQAGQRVLAQDALTRISLLIGIFKALNILYTEPLADAWVTLPNSNALFRGATPLVFMLQQGLPGILEVRRLLDARRGGQ